MQKIKKFKISLRPASVRKNYKELAGIDSLPADTEELLKKEYEGAHSWLEPAAVFNTFKGNQWPHYLKAPQGPVDPVAATLVAATVGAAAEKLIEKETSPQTPLSLAVAALAEEGAAASAAFVERLILEEAKGEDCELSEPVDIVIPADRATALKDISAVKIGIQEEGGRLVPRFTRIRAFFWIPRMTKRRRLILPSNTSAADPSSTTCPLF